MSARRVEVPNVRVDTSRTLEFSFDGKTYRGHPGDTLASALLANGVRLVARSFKYGRPRGVVGAGAEEPNALVQLETGARSTPNVKATQAELYDGLVAARTSGFPSLRWDRKALLGRLGAKFMPAGFYGKTFKWPARWWPRYEALIRGFAGFGHAPAEPDADWYDHLHHHVDVLVVGGGACGLLAARLAGEAGLKTLLIDEQSEVGGWLLSDPTAPIDGSSAPHWLAQQRAALASMPQVQVLPRTSGFGLYDQNLLLAVESLQDHLPPAQRRANLPRQRQHKIRAHHIVLATGAIERPLVFGNNDVPGVMTLAAGLTYLNRYGVLGGDQVLITGNHDGVYDAAADFAAAGARVTVVDARAGSAPRASKGVTVLRGHGVAAVLGRHAVRGARVRALQGGATSTVDCDLVLSSAGYAPTVHLYCHDGGRPQWRDDVQAFVLPRDPEQGRAGIACAGAVTGAFELGDALAQTVQALQPILAGAPRKTNPRPPPCPRLAREPALPMVRVPDGLPEGHGAKAFVDFQNDVTAADIALAVRESYHSIEHVKRYTALGFGTDQGKLSNVNGVLLTAEALGRPAPEVGTTTYRPAYTPVAFGALAGALAGETFDPRRMTAIHASHDAAGAVYENVGQWLRPWYFPRGGEDLRAAVARECLAARHGVAVMDASTLGKIQIDGADAREFLNRVYTNAWSKLEPGKCRYGLMLDENGMVMDDGVTACIGDTQFHMTTTTGGAARVMNWLERWHQTEWPELKVWLTSVTDHWSAIAVVGPKARDVMRALCSDIDFAPEAFKFMDWRSGTVAGVPARVFRISFSGEVSYEINVESGYGRHVWDAVIAAGAPFDIAPYGTETMHVLRAEKGFIIAGQDTDGSMTPVDLGMAWALSMKKDYPFLGKRSLARSDTAREGRKQLVGLLTDDPQAVLADGAQVIEQPGPSGNATTPVRMLGHVTSSYHSAFLGRSIALAVVAGGAQREGQTLYAWARGRSTPVKVAKTVFVDPQGARQHA
ncbi:MAG TPA: sarcosine oxidase subunit alpha family protein [Burkholderiaceae bacterium]|nr:sarcosine oxidase subunit alpha family protein [Burkholderiaceae bacterium]